MGATERVQDEPAERMGHAGSAPSFAILRRFGTLGFAAILALLTLEVAMRHYTYVPRHLDPDFGYVATGEAWWFREGSAISHWGSRGVRAASSRARGPEDKRLLVIGDSFTEATQVSDDEVYTDVLERTLRQAGRNVRVLNAGVAGSTLPYYVDLAPAYRRAFSPDWTVVQLNFDDVVAPAFAKGATHFERMPDGSLTVRALPPEGGGGMARRTLRFLRGHSALLQNCVLQYMGFAGLAKGFRPFRQTDEPPAPEPDDPGAFPIEQELLALLKVFDGRVSVLFLSPWIAGAPVERPTPTESSIQDACRKLRMSCVFTRSTFPRFVASGTFPNGFPNTRPKRGHLNAAGHAAVAEVLGHEFRVGTLSAVF